MASSCHNGVIDTDRNRYRMWAYQTLHARGVNRSRKIVIPVDTGRKLNVHKTFRRRPGRLLNVLCTFNLRPVFTGILSHLNSAKSALVVLIL